MRRELEQWFVDEDAGAVHENVDASQRLVRFGGQVGRRVRGADVQGDAVRSLAEFGRGVTHRLGLAGNDEDARASGDECVRYSVANPSGATGDDGRTTSEGLTQSRCPGV